MTLEIDENFLAHHLDGIKKLADSNNSKYNQYPKVYEDSINAYTVIGLYITVVDGKHVVRKSEDL